MQGHPPDFEDPASVAVCGDSRGRSLLLVVVAGTGRPTSDLTSKLLDQLWVLLLHLLSELLAPVGGAPSSAGQGPPPPPPRRPQAPATGAL